MSKFICGRVLYVIIGVIRSASAFDFSANLFCYYYWWKIDHTNATEWTWNVHEKCFWCIVHIKRVVLLQWGTGELSRGLAESVDVIRRPWKLKMFRFPWENTIVFPRPFCSTSWMYRNKMPRSGRETRKITNAYFLYTLHNRTTPRPHTRRLMPVCRLAVKFIQMNQSKHISVLTHRVMCRQDTESHICCTMANHLFSHTHFSGTRRDREAL